MQWSQAIPSHHESPSTRADGENRIEILDDANEQRTLFALFAKNMTGKTWLYY